MSRDEDRPETERDEENATRYPSDEEAREAASSSAVGAPSESDTNPDDSSPDAAAAGSETRTPDEDDVAAEAAQGSVETSEDGIRDLLRGALGKDEPDIPDVLSGVQRKLRQRSRGKFYADGWSTAKQPPISTYLITSLVMLAILFFVWAVLSPLSGEPASVDPPAPINVVPGTQHR